MCLLLLRKTDELIHTARNIHLHQTRSQIGQIVYPAIDDHQMGSREKTLGNRSNTIDSMGKSKWPTLSYQCDFRLNTTSTMGPTN